MSSVTEFPFCLVGMTEQEARKHCVDNDFIFRCVERDGKKTVTTRDLRMDRMNVAIEQSTIKRAFVG